MTGAKVLHAAVAGLRRSLLAVAASDDAVGDKHQRVVLRQQTGAFLTEAQLDFLGKLPAPVAPEDISP